MHSMAEKCMGRYELGGVKQCRRLVVSLKNDAIFKRKRNKVCLVRPYICARIIKQMSEKRRCKKNDLVCTVLLKPGMRLQNLLTSI